MHHVEDGRLLSLRKAPKWFSPTKKGGENFFPKNKGENFSQASTRLILTGS